MLLNEPLPPSDPVDHKPTGRAPWEIIFDMVLISGSAILLWNLLVVAGWVPGHSILLLDAYLTLDLGPKDWTFLIGLTLVGLAKVPAFYVVLNSLNKRQSTLTNEMKAMWLKLLMVLALMPWVYILMLYFLPPNGK